MVGPCRTPLCDGRNPAGLATAIQFPADTARSQCPAAASPTSPTFSSQPPVRGEKSAAQSIQWLQRNSAWHPPSPNLPSLCCFAWSVHRSHLQQWSTETLVSSSFNYLSTNGYQFLATEELLQFSWERPAPRTSPQEYRAIHGNSPEHGWQFFQDPRTCASLPQVQLSTKCSEKASCWGRQSSMMITRLALKKRLKQITRNITIKVVKGLPWVGC